MTWQQIKIRSLLGEVIYNLIFHLFLTFIEGGLQPTHKEILLLQTGQLYWLLLVRCRVRHSRGEVD